ncbi:aspartyl/glutamyl-tRNA(Asn/Gln) amidotransferase subunit B [Clostridium tepidiprofundi DSM 19306]|uniref:Aspartyl/glutamyl-tRNA(Asn/Gln) amidotransferase subunit B n=1 Tax=Clostridium tepidiprofundi DSM 19306 TaxID=1121338 RepID=A0A151B448_9CLOT|nr:Asp-tRNA(Asn)/Glu-tRNA(Gln) amidotransferase subunit GatB [Clostridium tepidiprofundi]KYH34689.1 aspartyl/glutamyl-tRNA(Asn/Gln) amidotransferase subunit B [Clostridium tepidiprofundi DSM 19306]
MNYDTVIGLEVHVELSTKTKIFCGCTTEFGGQPNTHVCPVCMGLPGALPTLNKRVVEYGIKSGLALGCSINKVCRMDRKNYFYPDAPRNYQITQDEFPICRDGYIDIEFEDGTKKRIGIERIHMEDDAGKLLHTKAGSLIDFNRAGVPLLEIVSRPDMSSAEEAILYLEKLKGILTCIGVSDCKMEQGSLRCDLNVSVKPAGSEKLGVRSEIKNLNSFKSLEKAIEYEVKRQIEAIENGEKLFVETRRWDEENLRTLSMRSKEAANDYRYFPEGDLVTLNISDEWIEEIRKTIPELPHEKYVRFIKQYNLPKYDANIITSSYDVADFFEETVDICSDSKAVANWIMGDISAFMNEKNIGINDTKITPQHLGNLIKLINDGKISNAIGKKVLSEMLENGKMPETIVEEKGLIQNSDESAILDMVKNVLESNPDNVAEYKNGRTNLFGWFVGQVMKMSKGKANPKIVSKLMKEEIEKM